MATTPTYRLSSNVIEADKDALLALQDLSDYAPVNSKHSVQSLLALKEAMERAEEAELRAQKAQAAARDVAISATWEFHKALQGAKNQVIAQYGDDSQAVQAIGLKKTSERKRVTRRRSASAEM